MRKKSQLNEICWFACMLFLSACGIFIVSLIFRFYFNFELLITSSLLKGAEATCVEIANVMKKCSRLKDMPNFNLLQNFQPI